ncbi:MAG TPA: NAD(P)-binding protein [Steroidobacteraceae bacterium]
MTRDGISRRDFLNGVALAIGTGLAPVDLLRAAVSRSVYPPALGGSRGSTDASFEVSHRLRDGQKFSIDGLPIEDTVDLVVVGAGISGLTAAHDYHRRNRRARILILENHDDFGGHARRCEFRVDGKLLIGYGGSESIQAPASSWSKQAIALLADLGISVDRLGQAFDRALYPGLGLSRGILFVKEAFGADKLVTGDPTRMVADDIPPDRLNARDYAAFMNDFPLSAESRKKLIALYTESRDVLAGKSRDEKQEILAATSYRDFLTRYWGLDDTATNAFQKRPHDFFAMGIDGVPALDAASTGYPGFQGLDLPVDPEAVAEFEEPYIYHFPDGNASIARLLVRRLIRGVAAGSTMEDVVTAPFDYSRLDRPGAAIRLRLDSTVTSLGNTADGRVDVGYVHDGALKRVQAKRAIHAGYNMMLPYMLSELPSAQREALTKGVKAPLVYVKLAVRNWEAWVKAGVHEVTNPMGFFSRIKLDYPVSLGTYRFARSPRDPIGLHLVHVPTPGNTGMDQRSAWRAGSAVMLATPFEQYESHAIDELTRILGPHGFVASRDIAAISVYRWGHGYAYGFNSLYDKQEDPELSVYGHQPIGRIAIANSDAAGSAYAHAAIEQGLRAVDEVL